MSKTIYISHLDIDGLQLTIMQHINIWAHKEKKPIPLQNILLEMEKQGIKRNSAIKAIAILLEKRYIRKSNEIGRKTAFVMLRSI